MAWYALDALSDARDATTALLLPVDRGRWLRLALIGLFVGLGGSAPTFNGGGNVPSGGGGGGGGGPPMPGGVPTPSFPSPGSILALVLAVVLVLLVVALLWSVASAVMEFVFVTGLRDREVEIRRPFRANLRRGLRLFGFRVVLLVATLLLIGVPLLALVFIGVAVPFAFLLLIPGIFVFIAVGLAGSIASLLTTDFVVPAMLTEDVGVLDGWRRLWPEMRAEWQQFALFVLVRFGLGIAASLAVGLVTLLGALVVAIPFAIVGGLVFVAASMGGPVGLAGWVVIGLLVALYVLAVVVVALVVQVPAVTFLRYYSLAVLGYADADLDLVGVERDEDDEGDEGSETDGDDGDDGDETSEADGDETSEADGDGSDDDETTDDADEPGEDDDAADDEPGEEGTDRT
ncbi:MAG: hypothetical protein ABEJ82_09295 [Haloplanus sp.]